MQQFGGKSLKIAFLLMSVEKGKKSAILLPVQNSQPIANFFRLIKYDLEQVIFTLFAMT